MWQRDLRAEWTLNAGNCYYWLSMGCWNLIKLFSWLIYYESCIPCMHSTHFFFSPFLFPFLSIFLFIHSIKLCHFVCKDQWTNFHIVIVRLLIFGPSLLLHLATFEAKKPKEKKRKNKKKKNESISFIEKFNLKRLFINLKIRASSFVRPFVSACVLFILPICSGCIRNCKIGGSAFCVCMF